MVQRNERKGSVVEKRGLATITIPVTGMTCAGCVGRVERALKMVPGMLDEQGSVRRRT
ncbi:MAG: heavy-metal-associated domain-containing protein [Rubrobacteraceae bacterium]|nr:heavy-metal-associated domain-containing protein [Rubrobacteraceae bacterium]